MTGLFTDVFMCVTTCASHKSHKKQNESCAKSESCHDKWIGCENQNESLEEKSKRKCEGGPNEV